MYQVNIHYLIDSYSASIAEFDADGYKGRVIDTVYEDGAIYTDYCVFTGSYEECEDYVKFLL